MSRSPRPALAGAVLLTVGALALTACAPAPSDDPTGGAGSDLQKVTIALDWTPNTNHLGLYAAEAEGYFADAGLDVEILPYASAPTIDLVASGAADFGVSTQASVQQARTAGTDVTAVYAVTQKETGALVTLDSRTDIASPRDLDGKVYGGFGIPLYSALARQAIIADGGTGDIQDVTLATGAYEALTSGAIDVTASIVTWENVAQELAGEPYKTFSYTDYGLPAEQTIQVVSSDAYLDAEPGTAAAFVKALQRGHTFAAENPQAAAQELIDANGDVLAGSEDLVFSSAQLLADGGYLVAEGVPAGTNSAEIWTGFGGFLVENGLLTDADGETVTEADAPDWDAYFSNDLLG
ncbi:ABC transporter substrate-binding protein [Microbacterium sp. 18062]|uniref:ABC transporter substrate-binding protein n=1 Tax=Microbacterium sp. 18062 TaxID=2681410 RepID=UPI00135B7C46|nr:ABC transporter substrate-binding protein [Microbacterium sp. 18062]